MKVQCAFCREPLHQVGDLFVHVKNNHPNEWNTYCAHLGDPPKILPQEK